MNNKTNQISDLQGSKTAELLQSLSKEEFKRFGLFIRSPYFNKSKKLEKLYDYFKIKYNSGKNPEISKAELWQYVNPGEKYDETNARKSISNFTKLAEEFLIITQLDNDEAAKLNLLSQISSNRKFKKTFDAAVNNAEDLYKNMNYQSDERYFNKLTTERLKFIFRGSTAKMPEEQLSVISKAIDLYYISRKLLLFYDILNLGLHYKKSITFDMWSFDEIVRFIENNKDEIMKGHPGIYGDYLSVLMMLYPDEKDRYMNLKNFVASAENLLRIEKQRFHIYLYNHTVYLINSGRSEFIKETFEVTKIIDDEKYPVWEFFAFHIYYLNAVTNSVNSGEKVWAAEFIEKHRNRINENIRQETFSLANAIYYHLTGNYNEALKFIVNVDYPNYNYYLKAKSILITIYFERGDVEGVLGTCDSLRKFLSRNELIPDRVLNSYTKFAICAAKLIEPDNLLHIYEAKKILDEDHTVANREWLLSKAHS